MALLRCYNGKIFPTSDLITEDNNMSEESLAGKLSLTGVNVACLPLEDLAELCVESEGGYFVEVDDELTISRFNHPHHGETRIISWGGMNGLLVTKNTSE